MDFGIQMMLRKGTAQLRIAISHEKQEIKEFYDKKFLTRKTGKKNKKLMKDKKALKSIVKRENF